LLRNLNIQGVAAPESSDVALAIIPKSIAEDVQPTEIEKITGHPLNYPNPFRKNQGTSLYYTLSKTMDIEIAIYSMMSQQITKAKLSAGLNGANSGPNKISLTDLGVDTTELSAGVYFFVIMNNGKVLGKGKMAVI